MNILIAGLGLIGGSVAKSLKCNTNHKIYGFDKSKDVLNEALRVCAIDEVLQDLHIIDLVIICLAPKDIVGFAKNNKGKFKKGCIVCDVCGIKENIVKFLEDILQPECYFVGTHPMAGKEVSGFINSSKDLFKDASLIITKTNKTDIKAVEVVEQLFLSMGFKKIVKTTPKEHDRIIAYTSQLAHIVSNAYIKSPACKEEKGFSAGSFQDLTRVAVLDEKLWTSLFMENSDNLILEIETLERNIAEYKKALKNKDYIYLEELLKDGRIKKEENLENKNK